MTSASRRPVVDIDLARIVSRDRLRKFRPAAVDVLAESIKARGQLQPILVQQCGVDFVLITGRHRLQAVRKLGHDTIRAEIIADDLDADQALLIEIDENLIRADLSPAERVLHISKRKELYERVHPETKHGAVGRGGKSSQDEISFVDDVAEKTGTGRSTVARDVTRANKVVVLDDIVGTTLDEGAELDALGKLSETEQHKLAKRAKAGEKVSAKHAGKKIRRQQRERELGAKIMAMPDKRYGVIYADPPWKFEVYNEDTGSERAADNHYPTMAAEEICKLKIPAADDAVLFLWVTVPMLEIAIDVMSVWGFDYKSNLTWKKKNKSGTGYWVRNQHEHLLIGVRGNVPAPAPGDQSASVIEAPVGKHSEKPAAFRQLIESMFPTLPKIELFARAKADGWDCWGNEAPTSAPASGETPASATPPSARCSGNAVDVEQSAEERRAFYAAAEATADPKKDGIPIFLQTQNTGDAA